jgi:uncharacterized protein
MVEAKMELKSALQKEKFIVNNFRHKKLSVGNLITTDHGSFEIIDDKSFEELKSGNVSSKEMLDRLEDKGIILTAKNIDRVKASLKERYSFLKQGTSLHIVVVTLRCNQYCIYCQASSRPELKAGVDMDAETAKKTVEFIFQSSSNEICIEFQGGEPLLNFPAIKKITEYANQINKTKRKDLIFTLVTNLTLMTEEILDYCIKNRIFICTSLDGPKFLHDKNRPCNKSSHDTAVYWIKRINDEYKKKKIDYTVLNALITVTRESLKYPKEIVDEYAKLGMKTMHLRFLSKLGYAGKNRATIEYSSEEFIAFWKAAVDYIIELNKKGIFFRERTVMTILKKIMTEKDPNYLDMRSPCGAVIGQMAYNYNGDVYSCDEGRMLDEDTFRIGNVKKDSYGSVLCSHESCAIVAASINDSQICDSCAYKPYCGLCPVCSYAEQGTTVGIIPKTTFCKVYMAQFDYVFTKYNSDKDAKRVFDLWLDPMKIKNNKKSKSNE